MDFAEKSTKKIEEAKEKSDTKQLGKFCPVCQTSCRSDCASFEKSNFDKNGWVTHAHCTNKIVRGAK